MRSGLGLCGIRVLRSPSRTFTLCSVPRGLHSPRLNRGRQGYTMRALEYCRSSHSSDASCDALNNIFGIPPRSDPIEKSSCVRKKPVITILGHVDHGKTTMLDFIRKSSLAKHEHGGITQRIGAFYAQIKPNHQVVFLDTPGHYLFSSMRSSTTNITDMSILVIAWKDGVKPQTEESINLLLKAKVAVNKCDSHMPEKNKRILLDSLLNHGVCTEEDGGQVPVTYVSALTGMGMDSLADTIVALEEVSDLRADLSGRAEGMIIETSTNVGQGIYTTMIVGRGTLNLGDLIVSGDSYCLARRIITADGRVVKAAHPSDVVQVDCDERYLKRAREARQHPAASDGDRPAKHLPHGPRPSPRKGRYNRQTAVQEKQSSAAEDRQSPRLCILIKADSHGSVQAISKAIASMVSHDCRLEVLASDVGNLKESDLDKCRACSIREGASRRAHILLFNLECPKNIKNAAEESDITVGSFYVIYDLLNHLRELVLEVVTPLEKTELSGTAEIKRVFHIYSLKRNNIICGSRVASGTVSVGDEFELCRSSEVLCTGRIVSMKILDKNVDSARKGEECGIVIGDYKNIAEGDLIRSYTVTKYKPEVKFDGG